MIEVIATTLEDAIRIERSGGDRIELISSLTEGGLTPSYGLIKSVVNAVNIPVNVMIRPHAKSFIYTDKEIAFMKEDIEIIRDLGANGVVLGTLTAQNEIDYEKLEQLLEVVGSLEVTFHRAIDELDHLVDSVNRLKEYDAITRILTSGGLGKAEEHVEVLKEMVDAAGEKVVILLGSGMNKENARQLLNETGAIEAHFGTAAREKQDVFGEISIEKLTEIITSVK